MRTLVGDGSYDWPDGPWLRANMVSTVDGSAQGADGLSGSINNDVDAAVFQQLRASCDVIIVGAGTALAEGYRVPGRPMLVVGSALPEQLRGADHVMLSPGGDADALRGLVADLRSAGYRRMLCEGGPILLGSLLAAGVVDEICATITPRIVGGPGKRIVDGPPVDVPLRLASLVEQDGTLLARWLVSRP